MFIKWSGGLWGMIFFHISVDIFSTIIARHLERKNLSVSVIKKELTVNVLWYNCPDRSTLQHDLHGSAGKSTDCNRPLTFNAGQTVSLFSACKLTGSGQTHHTAVYSFDPIIAISLLHKQITYCGGNTITRQVIKHAGNKKMKTEIQKNRKGGAVQAWVCECVCMRVCVKFVNN